MAGQEQTPNRKLYDLLVSENLYSKTYDEFNTQFATPEKVDKLFDFLVEEKLYSKTRGEFKDRFFPKPNEVSSSGSEVTSQTSGPQSGVSQPVNSSSGLATFENITASEAIPVQETVTDSYVDDIPKLEIEGTFRQGWQGQWAYDLEGHETYVMDDIIFEDVFQNDPKKAREYFSKEMPNVIVHLPFNEYFKSSDSTVINLDTAKPVDLKRMQEEKAKITQLNSTPFNQWSQEDKDDYFVAKMREANVSFGNVDKKELEAKRVKEQAIYDLTNQPSEIVKTFTTFFRNIGSGATSMGANILGIPELLYNTSVSAINGLGADLRTYSEVFGRDELLTRGRRYLQESVDRNTLYETFTTGDKGIWESFKSGDIANGINKTSAAIGQSVPYTLTMMAGSAGIMTAYLSSASGRYAELQEASPNKDSATMLFNAYMWGLAEVVPERIGLKAMLAPYKQLAKTAGKEVAVDALSKSFRQGLGKFNVITPHATEMITEMSTLVMQNALDEKDNLLDGWEDTLIVSGTMSGVMSSPGQVAVALSDRSRYKEVEKLSKANANVEAEIAKGTATPEQMQILTEGYLSNVQKINEYLEEELDRKGKLSSAQRAIVNDMEARKQRLASIINDPNISEEVKADIEVDIESINQDIQAVYEEQESTVQQNETFIETEQGVINEQVSESDNVAVKLTRDNVEYALLDSVNGHEGWEHNLNTLPEFPDIRRMGGNYSPFIFKDRSGEIVDKFDSGEASNGLDLMIEKGVVNLGYTTTTLDNQKYAVIGGRTLDKSGRTASYSFAIKLGGPVKEENLNRVLDIDVASILGVTDSPSVIKGMQDKKNQKKVFDKVLEVLSDTPVSTEQLTNTEQQKADIERRRQAEQIKYGEVAGDDEGLAGERISKRLEIDAKYDAELASLQPQETQTEEEVSDVKGNKGWDKDVESTAKALEGVDEKSMSPIKEMFSNYFDIVGLFEDFKEAVSFNLRRTARIGLDESGANYGENLPIGNLKPLLDKAGLKYDVVDKSEMADGNYASYDGDRIKITEEKVPLPVLLHEIGESVIAELDKAKAKIQHSNNIFESVTTYGASRGNDAFADNFYLYFLSPKTLLDLSPNVYEELNRVIPQNIKELGKSLMQEYGVEEQSLSYNKDNAFISEAYHKAKEDGTNPELVKAVEDLLGNPTESKSEPITPEVESVVAKLISESGRAKIKQDAASRIKAYWDSQKNLGISSNQDPKEFAKFIQDIIEYAAVSIIDGTIKSGKALAKSLGIDYNDDIQKAFDDANSAVNIIKNNTKSSGKSVKKTISESTEGKMQGDVTLTPKQLFTEKFKNINRGIKEGRIQVADAQKQLRDVVKELRRRGMLEGVNSKTIERLSSLIGNVKHVNDVQGTVDKIVSLVSPKESIKSRIDRTTDGGTKGDIILTPRQAFKDKFTTLNRGIREGKRQVADFREDIKQLVREADQNNLFKGTVRGTITKQLANRINNAKTQRDLENLLNYVDKATRIADYDKKVSAINADKARAKRIAKRKNMPANVSKVLKDASRIPTSYVEDVDGFMNTLSDLVMAAEGVGGTINSSEIARLSEEVRDNIEKARIDRIKKRLIDKFGLDADEIKSLKTLDEVQAKLAEVAPEDSKAQSKAKRERQIEFYKEHLEDLYEIDDTDFTPRQKSALNALRNIDIDEVSDNNLVALAAVAAENMVSEGKLYNVGRIEDEYKKQQAFNNTKDLGVIKSNMLNTTKLMDAVRNQLGSVFIKQDALIKNRHAIGAFWRFFGYQDYLRGYVKATKKVREIFKGLEDVVTKEAKELVENPTERFLLGFYLDLNNRKDTWTPDEVVAQFEGRKMAIEKSIELAEAEMELSLKLKNKIGDYINNLKAAYEVIKDDKSSEEIYSRLKGGTQKVADYMRDTFAELRPLLEDNAVIDNNVDFDSSWGESYFPRNYVRLTDAVKSDQKAQERLEDLSKGNTFRPSDLLPKGQTTSATKDRVLEGDQLPLNSIIDFDAITNFMTGVKSAVYDINTQSERSYMAAILGSGRSKELIGNADLINGFRDSFIQQISSDAREVLSRDVETTIRKFISGYRTLSQALALGGVDQVLKQSVPQISDYLARTGPSGIVDFLNAIRLLTINPDLAKNLYGESPVLFRDQQKIEGSSDTMTRKMKGPVTKLLNKSFGSVGNFITKSSEWSLKPLGFTDASVTRAIWLAYYIRNLKKNNKIDVLNDLWNIDSDAEAFANLQTEISSNVSLQNTRSNLYQNTGGTVMSILFPFESFGMNARAELFTNLGKLQDFRLLSAKDITQIIGNIMGNLTAITTYQVLGKYIRNTMILGASALMRALLSGSDDLSDEEKEEVEKLLKIGMEEQLKNNERNSKYYMIRDLATGGVAQEYTSGFFDLAMQYIDSEYKAPYSSPNGFDALGALGAPMKTFGKTIELGKEFFLTDAEWQVQKFSIEDEYGESRVVPIDYTDVKRPLFSAKGYGLATLAGITASFGLSQQSVGAIARRMPRLINLAEQELVRSRYGLEGISGEDVHKLKARELNKLKEIDLGYKKVVLSNEQFEEAKRIRKGIVDELLGRQNDFIFNNTGFDFDGISKKEIGMIAGEPTQINVIRSLATDITLATIIQKYDIMSKIDSAEINKYVDKKLDNFNKSVDTFKKAVEEGKMTPEEYEKRRLNLKK